MVGYSGKKLWQKLGMKAGQIHVVLNAPVNYLELLDADSELILEHKLRGRATFIHFFTASRAELESLFSQLVQAMEQKGILWISWPKKSSKVATDLDENIVRAMGLQLGIVDVKVCAVSEVWSGLKFLHRIKK